MTDETDDLDAFFDEVEEVAAQAEGDETQGADVVKDGSNVKEQQQQEVEEPPRKKAKPTVMGVVVAAASEKIKAPPVPATSVTTTASTTSNYYTGNVPPPPPPPPLPGVSAQTSSSAVGPSTGPLVTPGITNGTSQPTSATAAATTASTHKKTHVRSVAGKTWVDPTLDEWPENDFRIFVGNLDPTVADEQVWQAFAQYKSLLKAKIIRNNKDGTSKGYAFVSFGDALECAQALRQKDQTFIGSRPCRLKRSTWKDRELNVVRKQQKKSTKQQKRMGFL